MPRSYQWDLCRKRLCNWSRICIWILLLFMCLFPVQSTWWIAGSRLCKYTNGSRPSLDRDASFRISWPCWQSTVSPYAHYTDIYVYMLMETLSGKTSMSQDNFKILHFTSLKIIGWVFCEFNHFINLIINLVSIVIHWGHINTFTFSSCFHPKQ